MDISHWITHRADWSPDKVAIRFEGREITYAEMEQRVARLAGALRDGLGIGPGDRVAHLGYNSPELLELLFACARIGAILVPLNWRLTPAEHSFACGNCTPGAILVEPDYFDHVERLEGHGAGVTRVAYGPTAPAGWTGYEALVAAAEPVAAKPERQENLDVAIVYTSGTTGHPKGAVATQRGMFFNAVSSVAAFEMTCQDHVLTALPMFHVGGMHIQTVPAIYAGATVTIQARFDPELVVRQFREDPPTLMLSVPAASQAIVAHPGFQDIEVSSLRCFCTGSSTVPEAVMRPWLDRGIPVTQVYGSTESGPVTIALSIHDAFDRVGSAGKACAHVEVRIADDRGRTLPPGEKGEILVRGPAVMRTYWQDEAGTREALTGDGWLHTGDVGHMDEDGFYYVDDRKKDMIISGGENVYPAELENVLADCPALAEFAVIGMPHERWGETPVCCVILKDGAEISREEILALFDDRLARYKRPSDVIFVDQPLPRTSLGKVQKFELRRRLGV